jgi:hypothetical protein
MFLFKIPHARLCGKSTNDSLGRKNWSLGWIQIPSNFKKSEFQKF